jgi:antitoxin ParD1/3/4
MATMNISLPEELRDWVEQQVASGLYASASDYVRDVLRKDQGKHQAIAEMIALAEEGHASGISSRTPDEIFAAAKARFSAAKRRAG